MQTIKEVLLVRNERPGVSWPGSIGSSRLAEGDLEMVTESKSSCGLGRILIIAEHGRKKQKNNKKNQGLHVWMV